jgi:hypothetical protein
MILNRCALIMHNCIIMTAKDLAREPFDIHMQGYEVLEKVASQSSSSGRVMVPRDWVGKKVRIIRMEL